jgi:tocopherol cyclase
MIHHKECPRWLYNKSMNPSMLARLRTAWQPESYHGLGLRQNFFQGWYFKLVDASQQHTMAVIPGIFLGRRGQGSHSFV